MLNDIKTILISSRPISWLNTAYPFAAGYIIATHSFSWQLAAGTLYYLFPYNLLMYGVNDVFDYETDILNPRKGGIEGAVLAKSQHKTIIRWVLATNLPFLALLFFWSAASAKIVLALVIFMVVAYSLPKLRFKEIPFLDSLTSSSHFVGPLVFALVLVGWQANYLVYVLAFFSWGMASHAFGAVQDIMSDRAANIGSIATKLGAKLTVWLSVAFYSLSGIFLALTNSPSGYICAALSLIYIVNILPYKNLKDSQSAQ